MALTLEALGSHWISLGTTWGHIGYPIGAFGALWVTMGPPIGAPWGPLVDFWNPYGDKVDCLWVPQGPKLVALGLHLDPQGLHLAAQGLHLAAQGLYLAAQGLYLAA